MSGGGQHNHTGKGLSLVAGLFCYVLVTHALSKPVGLHSERVNYTVCKLHLYKNNLKDQNK